MSESNLAVIDTNVLVYAADESSEFHEASRTLRDREDIALAVTPQILMEFYAIITDSRRVTSPRSGEEARAEIEKYSNASHIMTLHPTQDVLARVITLLETYPQVTRQSIFDLFIVATMLGNGVNLIYTFNDQDFTLFTEIEVLRP
ncbi:type II toxin-antitoxin system VapC family toxin [Candidatus Entotheonella palauensis]|uniref:type II toxin-antitoxin system VapC family toxin n=1 Tax=Candidatus Entotheonella palauensis TaxID=93172 RepID=UPI000B7CD6F8|nr:PIN domain-containing protein [Candidatus Entotheonella palauensis]